VQFLEHLLDLGLRVLNNFVFDQVKFADLKERLDHNVHIFINNTLEVLRFFDHRGYQRDDTGKDLTCADLRHETISAHSGSLCFLGD